MTLVNIMYDVDKLFCTAICATPVRNVLHVSNENRFVARPIFMYLYILIVLVHLILLLLLPF